MLTILLAEDLPSERNILEEYLQRYAKECSLELKLRSFSDGSDLVSAYQPGADLILLDIDMGQMDGISAARKIRETDEDVQIVFITRMAWHALEGYEVQAADYIIKPVPYELFREKIRRVLKRRSGREGQILALKTRDGQRLVNSADVRYIETSGRHVLVHLASSDGHGRPVSSDEDLPVLETTLPLYQLESLLKGEHFFRSHSAYLISLRYVTGYSQTDVFLGDLKIPLSKHRRKDFVEALMTFHAGRL